MQVPSKRMPDTALETTTDYAYLNLLARVKIALDNGRDVAIPFSDVSPFIGQPRDYFNADGIRRLSESIDASGQTSSGLVRIKPKGHRYEIVDDGVSVEPRQVPGSTQHELIDGERRWRAVGLIPESRRPLYRARLISAGDDVVQYLISGITNFNREGHTAIETMRTIERHLELGFPINVVASLLGISEGWARQIHGLRLLKPEHQRLLSPDLPKAKQLSVLAAVQIAKADPSLQDGLVERVLTREITLPRLRGEVVRVAKAAGTPVRTREVEPRKRWDSFKNKVDLILRTAGDAENIIKDEEVSRFANANLRESNDLLARIAEAKDALSQLDSLIRRARK